MNEQFHKAQWEYYKSINCKIGKFTYHRHLSSIDLSFKDKDFNTYCSFNEFFNSIKKITEKFLVDNRGEQHSLQFFIDYYKKAPFEEQKELIKNFSILSGYSFSKVYSEFCDKSFTDIHDKIGTIKMVPITLLHSATIPYKSMDIYLAKNDVSESDILKFWIDIIKARKNQLNNPRAGAIVKKFLKEKYSQEQLQLFFPFFPYLKADYEKIDINIFDNKHTVSTISNINVKNMIKKFAILNWKENDYYIHFHNLKDAIKNRYNIEEGDVIKIDNKKIIQLEFHHTNTIFNLPLLNSLITNYLEELKANPTPVEYNSTTATVWLNKYLLDNLLEAKTGDIKKKKI